MDQGQEPQIGRPADKNCGHRLEKRETEAVADHAACQSKKKSKGHLAIRRHCKRRAHQGIARGWSHKDSPEENENEMIMLAQYGKLAFVALTMLWRWTLMNVNKYGNRPWVTSRTGNVTVITDKIF